MESIPGFVLTAKSRRILIADPNPRMLLALKAVLDSEGHRTTIAADGALAIELFRNSMSTEDPFGVIVADDSVKCDGGICLDNAIRALSASVVIVVLAAFRRDLAELTSKRPYANQILCKPPSLLALLEAVTR